MRPVPAIDGQLAQRLARGLLDRTGQQSRLCVTVHRRPGAQPLDREPAGYIVEAEPVLVGKNVDLVDVLGVACELGLDARPVVPFDVADALEHHVFERKADSAVSVGHAPRHAPPRHEGGFECRALDRVQRQAPAKRYGDAADQGRLGLVLVAAAVDLCDCRRLGQIAAPKDCDESLEHPLAQLVAENSPQALLGRDRGVEVRASVECVGPAEIEGSGQRQNAKVTGGDRVGLPGQRFPAEAAVLLP